MKTLLRFTFLAALVILVSDTFAQNTSRRLAHPSLATVPVKAHATNEHSNSSAVNSKSGTPTDPLSALVSVPSATYTGIGGLFDLQSHGRGIHNLQVDPNNPMKIHACAMTTTSTDPTDSNGSAYPSRRILYTYSNDGGVTWKTPVSVSGSVRTGYPDMVLYKRGSEYVPIITAHRYAPSSTSLFESAIFIETGSEGAGNFKEFDCDRLASDGSNKDILWPTIALSQDQTKLFIIGDFSDQANGQSMDYFEFGSFSLNADGTSATWNGWKAEPGREDGNTTKGFCQSGKHVIRVAENGTIGILWINPDAGNGDHNMYFVESKDGGATWPQNFDPLIPAVVDLDNNRAIAPNNGLDFYYINSKPQFVWETDEQNYNETDSNGYYFPYTGQIFFWSPNSGGNIKCLYYNDARGYIIDSIVVAGGPARVSADYLYQSTNFDVASIPTTQTIELPRYGWTSHTTLAPTSNPNVFAVFYQTLSNNDFATEQDRDGADVTEWFGNIYFQITTDGGSTWSEPRAYRDNSEGANQLDYHYPSISASNAASASGAQIQIMFQVDSLPGLFENGSGAGYSFNSWFYQNFSLSSVHSTGSVSAVASVDQNFPNPFISSTTIPVVMKNDDNVTLSLTDMLGREVATIYHGRLSAGSHRIPFTASNLGAGIYTYTLTTSTGSISHTMSLVK